MTQDNGARALAERLDNALAKLPGGGYIASVTPLVDAILANGAVFLPDAAELDRLRRLVKRAAGMGLCSQTHHEHLMLDARAALTSEGSARTLPLGPAASVQPWQDPDHGRGTE